MGNNKMDQAKVELEAWFNRMFGSESPTAEMRRNAQMAFTGLIERFDLVSRKEFKAQQQALHQAVKKLEALEQKHAKPKPSGTPARKPAKKQPAKKQPAKKNPVKKPAAAKSK